MGSTWICVLQFRDFSWEIQNTSTYPSSSLVITPLNGKLRTQYPAQMNKNDYNPGQNLMRQNQNLVNSRMA